MGIFANTGVSISVQDTLPKGRKPLEPLTDFVTGWSHTSAAIGGYLSATANISNNQGFIDEWLEGGLGRWLTLYDEGGIICWRGFVDKISANIGGLNIERGPLTDVTNRVHMVYSTVDTSTTPPTMGIRASTAQTNDTASQALYGIWQKALSTGGTTAAMATQLQNMYLQEHAAPETSKKLSIGKTGNLNMTLSLKGAVSWLSYIANFTTTGALNLSTRLIAVLALDPNTLFSTDTTHITANTFQVAAHENDDKRADQYLEALLAYGDATLNRYTGGFYGEEVYYYQPMPTTVDYLFSLSDPAQNVTTPSGIIVRPWEVQPARWLTVSDLMIGRVPDTDMRDDPRNMFIESLTYSAPYNLQINGAKISTLAQRLAGLGISGIGG